MMSDNLCNQENIVMTSPIDIRGRIDVQTLLIIMALIVSGFSAGLIVFLYLKFKRFDMHSLSTKSRIGKAFIIAVCVTVLMIVGSITANLLFSSLFDKPSYIAEPILFKDMLITACFFFAAMVIAFSWVTYIQVTYRHSVIRRRLFAWLGLLAVFTLYDVRFWFVANVDYLYDDSMMGMLEFVLFLPLDVLQWTIYGVWYMVTGPIDYLTHLFMSTNGNQFLVAEQFSRWSLLLLSVFILSIPFRLRGQFTRIDLNNPNNNGN
ncbi:hypothetical protein L4C36_21340 [Photobacterium japonica]|uniref:hypothetical protein n=1 Tax=Photobacterium japonica TaxID=2910235 RepID=UPI003D0C2E16